MQENDSYEKALSMSVTWENNKNGCYSTRDIALSRLVDFSKEVETFYVCMICSVDEEL
jgi:hypothetical protein